MEKITYALDSGKVVRGVFIDFKKTYDTVSHDILLRKLEAYGIKNNVIRLIKSYLSDKKNTSNIRMENQMLRVSYMKFPKALY